MMDSLYGFEVHPDQDDAMSTYSRNRIQNGDAETGDTNPWLTDNVTVVPGGVVPGSAYVFKVAEVDGRMEQIVPLSGSQAPDYKILGRFLPDDVISDVATQVKIFGKIKAEYATGEDDIHILPVMEPMAYKPEGIAGD